MLVFLQYKVGNGRKTWELVRAGPLDRTSNFLKSLFTFDRTLTSREGPQPSSSSSGTDGRVSDWQGGHSGADGHQVHGETIEQVNFD